MFQIAACIGYAKENGCQWGVRKGYVEQGFGVNQVDRFFPGLPECYHTFRGYAEPYFYHQQIPWHSNGVRIVGFWQSYKYFANAEEEVRKRFKLPITPGYEDYVSIHVRRGDYVQHSDSFPPITVDYVEQAMMKIRKQKYIVFSDDIEWCKTAFSHLNNSIQHIEYSEGRNEYEDLALMASCGHHIISNSTLAWWGAWLGHNANKVVICPHHLNWFGPSNPHRENTFDLFPKEWIEIKFR